MSRSRWIAGGGALLLIGCLDGAPTDPATISGAPGELVPATAWLETGGVLTMSLTGSGPFRLESSDARVVAVESGGRIRAVGPGTAQVRALMPGGRSTARVTVLAPTPSRQVVVVDSGLTDVSLLGIWSIDASTSYAVGVSGTVLQTTDAGANWRRIPLDTEDDFVGVWAAGLDDVWVVGAHGAIYHYDGASWGRWASGTNAALLEVWGLGRTDVYAVGLGVALHFDGVAWRSMPGALGSELWAVWGTHPDTLFATGQNGVILRWDGDRWRPMSTPTDLIMFGLYGTSAHDVYAAGIRGTLLHYNGDNWVKEPLPSGADLFALAGRGRAQMVSVGDDGAILIRNGSTWTYAPPETTNENLRAIAFDPAGVIRIAGWAGTIIRRDPTGWHLEASAPVLFSSTLSQSGEEITVGVGSAYRIDQGGSTRLARPTQRTLYGMARGPGGRITAVGDDGLILEYDGARWGLVGLGEQRLLRSIWTDPSDPDYAVLVGEGGLIMERRNGAWVSVPSPTTRFLRHVSGISRDVLFAVGDSGTVLRAEHGRWAQLEVPADGILRGVWASGPDDVHAVGEHGVALRYDGRRWSRISTPTDLELRAVYGLSPTEVYAVGFGGIVLRFDGSAWRELGAPTSAYLLSLLPGAGGSLTAVGTNRTVLRLEP